MDKIALKGVSWNLLENMLSFVVKFAIGIVLARMVSVEDYGVIGIASIFISFTDVITNSGLGQAYVQLNDLDIRHANGLILVNVLVASIVAIILWIAAPFIAVFFKTPILTSVIHWMTIAVVLNAISTIQIAHCRKIIKFKTKSIVSIVASSLSGALGIFCAYHGWGVWSLVVQQITNRLMVTVGLFIFANWSFGFILEKELLKSMLKLGKWAFGSNMVMLLFNNFYRLIFGKFLSLTQLSYYDRGQQFPNLLTTQLSWSFNMVALPHFVKKRDNIEELKDAHFKFVKYIMCVLIPLLGFLFLFSDQIIIVLLTKKWIAVSPIMKYLCIISLFIPFYDLNIQVFQTKLFNRLVFLIDTSRVVMRIANVFICLKLWGIYGILIGEIIISVINYLMIAILSPRKVGYNFFHQFNYLRSIIIAAIIALVTAYFFAQLAVHFKYFIVLVFAVFAAFYWLIMIKLDKKFLIEAKTLFLKKD